MIYKDLLLSKGGGIIDRNRLAEQSNVPTVFIGIGGTGIDCLREVKKAVFNRIKPDNPESPTPEYRNVQFLGIDTDRLCLQDAGTVYDLDENTEFVNISVFNSAAIAFCENKSLQWFNENLSIIDACSGSGAIRQVGRLATFLNIDKIINKITQKIEIAYRSSDKSKMNIHIFTGMGGGTGSGCFLDVCYLIQYIINHLALFGVASVKGYLFLPDVNLSRVKISQMEKTIETNAYAFMKELDYCMNFENNGGEWEQDYGNNIRVVSKTSPVDAVYLIDGKTEDGSVFQDPYSYAMNTVADYVLYEVAHILAKEKAEFIALSALDNTSKSSSCRYIALGSARAYIPYKEIITYLSSMVIQKYDILPTSNHDIDTFITESKLTYTDLLRMMQDNVPDVPMLDLDYHILYEEVQGISSDTIPWCLSIMIDSRLAIEDKILKNKERCVKTLLNKLKEKLIEISIAKDKGPKYASLFINNFEKDKDVLSVLDGYLRANEEKLSHSYAELESRQHVIAVTLNELQSARGFRRKRRAQDYVMAVHNYFSLLAKNALLRQMSDFLQVFRKEIQHIYNDFFQPLITILKNLRETAEMNLNYLSIDSQRDYFGQRILVNNDIKETFRPILYDLDVERVLISLTEHIIQTSMNVSSEKEVEQNISNFFNDIFSDILNRSIDGYFSQIFNTNSPIILSDRIHTIMQTLNNLSQTLIYLEDAYNRETTIGVCSIPIQSNILKQAAQQLNQNFNEILVEQTYCPDSISIIKTKYCIPICALKKIKAYKTCYEKCTWKGLHLYEGYGEDGKDFRRLPDLC